MSSSVNPELAVSSVTGNDLKGPLAIRLVAACGEGGSLVSNSSDRIGERNAHDLVRTVTELALRDLQASACVGELVESLVWPFVVRRSLRSEWFSDKEFRRFVNSIRKSAIRIQSIANEDNMEQTYIKFWLDTYLCQGFQDSQRPPALAIKNPPLFVGWCKRFVARAVAQRDMSFLYSLQKGTKQMWPPLGEKKKTAALEKHKERLSTFHGTASEELLQKVRDVSLGLFGKIAFKNGTKFMPSGSACLQASRREGGALSLFTRYSLPTDKDESAVMGKLPYMAATLESWRKSNLAFAANVADARLGASDLGTPALDVAVQAIPEPGKFRIITKGDGYLYTALQPIQGQMLSAWKKHYASTMLHPDLTKRVQEIDRLVKLPFWCSVDYEAATDLLKKLVSLAAISGISHSDYYEYAAASLLPGNAIYPNGDIVRAIEGQLMGHPLSFACLCLINLAVYLVAVDRWIAVDAKVRRETGAIMKKNVIVNGDDMLFKCDESFYLDFFLPVANDAGFKISQGKQYLSSDACMINSQLFIRRNGEMKRCGYLNLRLVKGSSLKNGDSKAVPTMISRDLSKMAQLCPWTKCVIPSAMARWKKDWFGPRYRPNWYLPVHLGGLGVDISLAPASWRITKNQREVAAMFIADPKLGLYRMDGVNMPTAQYAGAIANWRIQVGDFVQNEHESFDFTDGWLARIAYAVRATGQVKEHSDAYFVSKFFPQYRLKPFSREGLELYWNARWMAVGLPRCPPLGVLKVRELEARFGLTDEIQYLIRPIKA